MIFTHHFTDPQYFLVKEEDWAKVHNLIFLERKFSPDIVDVVSEHGYSFFVVEFNSKESRNIFAEICASMNITDLSTTRKS